MIEIHEPNKISHPENLIYDAHCYSCNNISKESGDFIAGPLELAGIEKRSTRKQAEELGKQHEEEEDKTHRVVIRGLDYGAFKSIV